MTSRVPPSPDPKADRPLRADASRNRAALLEAASHMFAEHGYDVPMSDIAAAAGVGRTTLLRNFPTRMDLASALFEQSMARIRALAASQTGAPGDLEALLDLKLGFYVQNGGLAEAVQRERGDVDSFQAERREVAEIFLNAARGGGDMRPDLTVETCLVMQQAIAGAIMAGKSRTDRIERARLVKVLLLDGLRTRKGG